MANLIEQILGIYSILLITISTIGNTLSSLISYRLGKKGIPTCKLYTFNQYFSLEALSWLLAYSMIDQSLQLYFPKIKYNSDTK